MDGRDAKVITYVVGLAGDVRLNVRLWIDAGTGLPLKREVDGTWAATPVHVVETGPWDPAAAADDAAFALPAGK